MNDFYFDFSKLNAHECQQMQTFLVSMNAHTDVLFTVQSMSKALTALRWSDVTELHLCDREVFGGLFDKVTTVEDQDIRDDMLRQTMVKYLAHNDRNGVWLDDDRLAEDMAPLSLWEASEALTSELRTGTPDDQ